uniref:Uncharacterized protein n=1 Tax=Anopheles merus TaxID=30066 RepID=A0A182UML7_ANOME
MPLQLPLASEPTPYPRSLMSEATVTNPCPWFVAALSTVVSCRLSSPGMDCTMCRFFPTEYTVKPLPNIFSFFVAISMSSVKKSPIPSTLQKPLADASGSTPIAAHISWNWRRNWGFFLISLRCLDANSSRFSFSASICFTICSNWDSCSSVPLSLYFSASRRCFWIAPTPARRRIFCTLLCTKYYKISVTTVGSARNTARSCTVASICRQAKPLRANPCDPPHSITISLHCPAHVQDVATGIGDCLTYWADASTTTRLEKESVDAHPQAGAVIVLIIHIVLRLLDC